MGSLSGKSVGGHVASDRALEPTQPLQVLLFRHHLDPEAGLFEEAIVRAFQGGKDAGGYLATGEDLDVQLELYTEVPRASVDANLSSASHTLVVVLVDEHLLGLERPLWEWFENCWARVRREPVRHRMLVMPLTERLGQAFAAKSDALSSIQQLQAHALGEPAGRPPRLAMLALHAARELLAAAVRPTDQEPSRLRIFVSHAKLDGLPLAHALRHEISTMPWLDKFYDVDDIPPGADWQRELELGVSSSVVLMLRTDAYDRRPWCQREVLWAEEYLVPSVLVDARTTLGAPSGGLPFDSSPWVRIPDGNLFRILFAAIREDLRSQLFARRVESMRSNGDLPQGAQILVLGRQPSMSALARVCRILTSGRPASHGRQSHSMILYPDPPLRAGLYEAAHALVAQYAEGTRLVTPQSISAAGGTNG
jgi:hypothetical protein